MSYFEELIELGSPYNFDFYLIVKLQVNALVIDGLALAGLIETVCLYLIHGFAITHEGR